MRTMGLGDDTWHFCWISFLFIFFFQECSEWVFLTFVHSAGYISGGGCVRDLVGETIYLAG